MTNKIDRTLEIRKTLIKQELHKKSASSVKVQLSIHILKINAAIIDKNQNFQDPKLQREKNKNKTQTRVGSLKLNILTENQIETSRT